MRRAKEKPVKPVTDRQFEYIVALSSYEATKAQDDKDIAEFLADNGVSAVSDLTIGQASDLIKVLLLRPVRYRFPCGLYAILHKEEYNRFVCLGDLEACLHACPDPKIGGDVNSCPVRLLMVQKEEDLDR